VFHLLPVAVRIVVIIIVLMLLCCCCPCAGVVTVAAATTRRGNQGKDGGHLRPLSLPKRPKRGRRHWLTGGRPVSARPAPWVKLEENKKLRPLYVIDVCVGCGVLLLLQIPNQLHFFTKIGDFLHARCKKSLLGCK
jgi:hypothetical protein